MSYYKKILYFIALFLATTAYPQEDIPLKKGNLALPSSQQPGPLLGFGQNVIDKGNKQFFAFFDITKGKGKRDVDFIPSFLYGITNHVAFMCTLPITSQKDRNDQSSGVGDLILQVECDVYLNKKQTLVDEATIVGSLILPTGSWSKNPHIGFGAPSFFGGVTWNRTAIDWYFFASSGATISMTNNRNKAGNQYLLQCGVGRNIPSPSETIFMGMAELSGLFTEDDKINGVLDNSGRAILYLVPSLWFSSEKIVVQAGFGVPLFQHVNGDQPKNDYLLAVNFGITF